MSPDSKYVSLIVYATKIGIDLCNFPAIWVVLSILLDTQSNELQHVKNLQQVVDDYYDKHPTEVMSRLEHQITDIMNTMYNSIDNDNFDSVSDYTDRVSGVVDNDYDRDDKDNDDMPYDKDNDDMPYDKDNDDMPYDKDNDDMPNNNDDDQMPDKYASDNETAINEVKYDRNMTNVELKDVGTKDVVLYKRDDKMMTKVKWPIETSDIDDEFMREYDDMCKSMEYRQINDYYEAQRHIQSAMKGDTPLKTGQNRQCIDNIINIINGQYRNEMYKRAENMVPQLDGTYNVSDDSDIDSHSYLDLTSSNIIVHRTRGQKQRYEINTRANTNRCLALKEDTKLNMNVKTLSQKVPDDEDIDINKIVRGDRPKDDRNSANITAKQYKEKEAKRLALEKAKRIQGQNDMKDKEAKRFILEKAKIEALIEKHRPRTLKTPDEVNTLGTGKNAKVDGQEGTEKGIPHIKRQQRISRLKDPTKRE